MSQFIPQQQAETGLTRGGASVKASFRALSAARKVPQVTLFFWIIKVLSIGMGETSSDYLVRRIDPVIAVALAGVCFVVALALQCIARRYVPWIF